MSNRLTVDTITSDALDALYEQLEAAEQTESERQLAVAREALASATTRAALAEAALARVHALANRWSNALAVDMPYARELLAVLGPAPRCNPKSARGDHPIHELLAALKSGLPHPNPVDVVRRYYLAIHDLCCPYDHTEPRPGYAAAANRAALDESRPAAPEVVHPEPNSQASEPPTVDEQPGCGCTYGQRCPNCRD